MNIETSRIQDLVNNPSEGLSIEVKRWIDPDQPEGMAKVVRASLALRNHGGGYLVIGFDNATLQPDKTNVPTDVKGAFHIDKIQSMIARFASEPFEVTVEYAERERQLYPVIVIPTGVKTPVAAKSDLCSADRSNRNLITAGNVYIRSLKANNTPSTAKAMWNDWPQIVETCFDNREADIGRFLRRHLSGIAPELLHDFAKAIKGGAQPKETTEDLLRKFLQDGEQRYVAVRDERGLSLPDHGSWEVGLLIQGDVPTTAVNDQFLNLLNSSNPSYTGWPIWLDTRFNQNANERPYVFDGAWEAFLSNLGSGWFDHIEFMRLDPKGRFYLRRALEDDIGTSPPIPPVTVLDFGLPIVRCAEALAVGLAFAKAMGYNPDVTLLSFAFRWKRLKGRQLASWANRSRSMPGGRVAHQDEVISFVNLPLAVAPSALSEFANQAVQPLLQVFGGFTLGQNIVEDLTRRLIERKL